MDAVRSLWLMLTRSGHPQQILGHDQRGFFVFFAFRLGLETLFRYTLGGKEQ